MDFAKFDTMVDLEGLKQDIAQAAAKDPARSEYKDVPFGTYEVALARMELVETKSTGKPMVSAWFRVVSGEFKGQMIFMNQVVTQGFQLHMMNDFCRSLFPRDHAIQDQIKFDTFTQYAELILDVAETASSYEYALVYGENAKGFKTFHISEIFELEA